ncbi:MAG: RluA family pseudouridine synthase [Treponema sp.]|nr:RluA family pseudouridine synthase [Treponema sp.]
MLLTLTAGADDDGRRLDRILRKAVRELPLSAIHRLLRQGCVCINGNPAQANSRIRAGQIITIPELSLPRLKREATHGQPDCSSAPAHVPCKLEILFEGAGLLILNKPAGVAAHGEHSLETLALSYLTPRLPPSLSFKPGPLHRLDKPSSGVIAFSADLRGAQVFSAMMRERRIKKFYLAVVCGYIDKDEVWQDELRRDRNLQKTFATESNCQNANGVDADSKRALTRVKPLAQGDNCTLILAEIETGRSHQIRAQAAARRHPLLYDKKYGGGTAKGGGFLLHAWRMEFPKDAALTDVPTCIQAPIPDYFTAQIQKLFGKNAITLVTRY